MAAGTVVMTGAVLRVLGAGGDLWLDEIWSIELARIAGSAGAVFTQHHDNNHYLNTLWLLLLGYDVGSLPARLLAVVSGTATVALAAVGDSSDRLRSIAWAFLLAFSYVAVHYGSEARGYGPAMFFAVAAFLAMQRLVGSWRPVWAATFAVTAVLGLRSHLTFFYALLAFAAWAGAAAVRDRHAHSPATRLATAFLPPGACLAWLWAIDLRLLEVGGGPPYRFQDAVPVILRVTFGTPGGMIGWLGVAAFALAVAGFARLVREHDLRWVFFMAIIVLAPAVTLAVLKSHYLAPRYFLVAIPFVLWLCADGLARIWSAGTGGAVLATALAALFLAGNGVQIERLIRLGRGQYRAALEYVVRNEPGPVATVGSDNDFRNPTVIRRYLPDIPGAARFRYVQSPEWEAIRPGWALAHHFEEDPVPDAIVLDPGGGQYHLVRVFPYAGLSGWAWYVYRRTQDGVR